MEFLVAQILSGVSLGGQYALIAIGYTMVYGILRLINFAHGDVFMCAGLMMVFMCASLPVYVSIPLMLVLTVLLGFVIERAAYKPLRSAPRMSVMISAIGVSYLLQNVALYATGGQPQTYPSLPFVSGTVTILGASTHWVTVITPVLVIVLVLLLQWLINHTKIGMAMRETSQLMGIKINKVISVTFIIGSFLAAVGSLLYFTNYPTVIPTSGAMPGLKAFVAAVFGGIGSIPGAVIGAFIIGICETLIKGTSMTVFSDAFTFALLIVVKEARRGNLITFAIVLALTLVTMVLENVISPGSLLFTVIKKGAVYSLVAVSMNLLNGFTGLFSLGQAGFMLLGAYAYAIFMIPDAARDGVYYLFEGSSVHFSFQEMFQHLFGATGFGGGVSLVLGVLVAIIFAGLIAAFFAYLIGLPVLRLKSDYLAIATLGFAEILRAIFQWQTLGKVTNGANILKGYPTFADFNITNASGKVLFRLSAVMPILLAGICIFLIVLLINSSYGRAFKAIRDDEIAAEAMGVNLAKHKSLSFVISSFFAGVSGALFAMFATTVQAKVFTSAMTYEILLIVVIGGIGSVSGSCIASFLYIACSEWWLRFLDNEAYIGAFKVPLLRNGFRMVVFSIIIMIVVLFFRKGIMGERELPDLFRKRPKKAKKNVVEEGKADE